MAHKTKPKKKVSEVYENPYFGKKKPSGIMSRTWDVTKNYGFGKGKKTATKSTKWSPARKLPWKLTTKPTKKSTLTGTDTTRGGGPDAGNIGYNKDFIYRHGKHRKKWREEMEKKPTPYRVKHNIGSIVKGAKKIISKIKPKQKEVNVDRLLKNLGDEIKAAPLPPQLKKLGPKLKKAFPHHDSAGKLKKAKGGRIGYQSGGRTRLLEELGRVEAEPSNRNRRAEVSRIHSELNRGYKGGGRTKKAKGGRIGLQHGSRPRPSGPHTWVKSGGAVLKGKKVGIQIK